MFNRFNNLGKKIRTEEDKSWINVDAIICECEGKLSTTDDFHALLSRGIV